MIHKVAPAVNWIRTYNTTDLKGDLSAGLIIGVMLIPQGMAYGMLAGLPAVMGLYAALIPLLVYAVFGTSRHLALGPVAIVSLLTLNGLSKVATPGTGEYVAYAVLLAWMVGLVQFTLGIFKAGLIAERLPHAVISGFTSAAAIIIGTSQLKHLTGVSLSSTSAIGIVGESVARTHEIHGMTLLIGIAGIAALVLLRKLSKRIPAHLVVVALFTGVVALFGLDRIGVSIVGQVPVGMPPFTLPTPTIEGMLALGTTAVLIALIGYLESFAIARSVAGRAGYRIDANQELRALGLANLSASFFSAGPVAGSFSRTAVNYQAGARTTFASVIAALIIALTLLFLTPLFVYLPHAILASIIIVAVYSLVNVAEARHLLQHARAEGVVLLVTFAATLLISVEIGLLIGIASAFAAHVVAKRMAGHPAASS